MDSFIRCANERCFWRVWLYRNSECTSIFIFIFLEYKYCFRKKIVQQGQKWGQNLKLVHRTGIVKVLNRIFQDFEAHQIDWGLSINFDLVPRFRDLFAILFKGTLMNFDTNTRPTHVTYSWPKKIVPTRQPLRIRLADNKERLVRTFVKTVPKKNSSLNFLVPSKVYTIFLLTSNQLVYSMFVTKKKHGLSPRGRKFDWFSIDIIKKLEWWLKVILSRLW